MVETQYSLIHESEFFDKDYYLKCYPDISVSGMDPLMHYIMHGWLEGRDPSASFSTGYYLKSNADVARDGINPLLHYVLFGKAEGRQPKLWIDPRRTRIDTVRMPKVTISDDLPMRRLSFHELKALFQQGQMNSGFVLSVSHTNYMFKNAGIEFLIR